MSLILDLEDTIFTSYPNGNLKTQMVDWLPIAHNISLIQEHSVLANDIIILSYAIGDEQEKSEAEQILSPQLKRFFPKASKSIIYLSISDLCNIWKDLFCLYINVEDFCLHYTKEMVAQTIFLRRPDLLEGSLSYFFDDCVSDHSLLSKSKCLKIISVPKPN